MNIKKAAILAALGLGFGMAQAASVITINWTDGGSGAGNANATNTAGVVPGAWINTVSSNAQAKNNTDVTSLFDNTGASSGVSITASGWNAGSWMSNITGYNGPSGTNQSDKMMENYADTSSGTITFSGLNNWLTTVGATSYDVYYYSERTANQYSGSISVGSQKYFLSNGSSGSSGNGPFALGTDTTLASAVANVDTANYVKFSGVAGDSFTMNVARDGGSGWIDLNGVQIVAVPEPSSTLRVIGVFGLGLLQRRRRCQ